VERRRHVEAVVGVDADDVTLGDLDRGRGPARERKRVRSAGRGHPAGSEPGGGRRTNQVPLMPTTRRSNMRSGLAVASEMFLEGE
jgi:hypothetical protein